MKTSQLARQLQLIELLYSPRGRTVEQLATDLRCSTRTVFRDLNCLERAGIDVLLDSSDKHYSLAPHFGVLTPRLFGDELMALALAISTTPLATLPAMASTMEQALGKLVVKAPLEQREQIERVVRASRIKSDTLAGNQALLQQVITALAGKTELRITCRTKDGRVIVHDRITPVSVHNENGQWACGFEASPTSELLVLLLDEIAEAEPVTDNPRTMGRHLLSEVGNEVGLRHKLL